MGNKSTAVSEFDLKEGDTLRSKENSATINQGRMSNWQANQTSVPLNNHSYENKCPVTPENERETSAILSNQSEIRTTFDAYAAETPSKNNKNKHSEFRTSLQARKASIPFNNMHENKSSVTAETDFKVQQSERIHRKNKHQMCITDKEEGTKIDNEQPDCERRKRKFETLDEVEVTYIIGNKRKRNIKEPEEFGVDLTKGLDKVDFTKWKLKYLDWRDIVAEKRDYHPDYEGVMNQIIKAYVPLTTGQQPDPYQAYEDDFSDNDVNSWAKCYAKNDHLPTIPCESTVLVNNVSSVFDMENELFCDGFPAFIETIVHEFALNRLQTKAFRLIASTILESKSRQLIFLVCGDENTGKNRIIEAVTCLFDKCKMLEQLQKMAYTGTAAHGLRGKTIHSQLKKTVKGILFNSYISL